MSWKQSLDRYLTSAPDDGFDDWCEEVYDKITDDFYNQNESWLQDCDGVYNSWLNKLFNRYEAPKKAALIIERAFNLFKL